MTILRIIRGILRAGARQIITFHVNAKALEAELDAARQRARR